ncbi:MAG TPA: hypothetical protein VHN77_10800 [Phycisphaerales bacterium]|nr:hypothetical protein [Phycisphaerales bacterium]
MPPPPTNFRPEPNRANTGGRAGNSSSRAAGGAPSPAPGLSTDRGPRNAAPSRARPDAPAVTPATPTAAPLAPAPPSPHAATAPAARTLAAITPAEAQARLRATMPAHIAAAAKVARVEPRVTKTLEDGSWEVTYQARWGFFRGRPCLTWCESRRELMVSVKHLFREVHVHTFAIRSTEHYGVIAQTAMSLVVGRAK